MPARARRAITGAIPRQRVNQQIDKLLDAYQEGLLGLGELRHRMPALRKKQAAAQKELESGHWQALADEQLRQLDQSLETFLGRLQHRLKTSVSLTNKKSSAYWSKKSS